MANFRRFSGNWLTPTVEEITHSETSTVMQAYRALQMASDRIGASDYKDQVARHKKAKRSMKIFQFFVSDYHKEVIAAMDKVIWGEITPDEAMCLLHGYEVFNARTK